MIYRIYPLLRSAHVAYGAIHNTCPVHYNVPASVPNQYPIGTCVVGGDLTCQQNETDAYQNTMPVSLYKTREVWPSLQNSQYDRVYVERILVKFKNIYYPYAIRVRNREHTYHMVNVTHINAIYQHIEWPGPTIIGSLAKVVNDFESHGVSMAQAANLIPPLQDQVVDCITNYPYSYTYTRPQHFRNAVCQLQSLQERPDRFAHLRLIPDILPPLHDALSLKTFRTGLTQDQILDVYQKDHPTEPGEGGPLIAPPCDVCFTVEDKVMRPCIDHLHHIVADEIEAYVTLSVASNSVLKFNLSYYFDRYVGCTGYSNYDDDIDMAADACMSFVQYAISEIPHIGVYQQLMLNEIVIFIRKTSNEEALLVAFIQHPTGQEKLAVAYLDLALATLTCYSIAMV